MTALPPPVEGRERAARRWIVVLGVSLVLLMIAGVVAIIVEFIDLPSALMWPTLTAVALGLVGMFVGALGVAWTRNLRWYQAIWLGLRAVREAFCMAF